jgi:DAK2 domain fusion protein YloV
VPDKVISGSIADGQDLKDLVRAGLAWLQHNQEAINVLNVFPVPDGDTGTNMVLTMQSAWKEVADLSETHVGEVAQKVAHGALMGARGNSGVILSQIWRGLARGLDGKGTFDGPILAEAMEEGVETAYKGVIRPVEGTILTVVREAAEEAVRAAGESGDLVYVLEKMVLRAYDALSRTPEMLPVLAEAGVVDAGGQGLCAILEGMLRHLRGENLDEIKAPIGQAAHFDAHVPGEEEYGYDVQFILVGTELDVDAIRTEIDNMGDSTLVVGDPTTVKVHVHVEDPGVPLSYAAQRGSLRDVIVEDMQAQYQEFLAQKEAPSLIVDTKVSGELGLVAVVAGDGLARVFQSLGAGAIVGGGQTMNPSTEEILKAAEGLPSEKVIVLPNNKNIILAAEQARDLSEKPIAVVPTRTIPQGVAALLALNYQAGLDENSEAMTRAAQEVQTGEVTTATRDVEIGGVVCREGEIIGIHDGELVVTGETPGDVVVKLLERMEPDDLEIVTLYYGHDLSASDADELVEVLEESYPELEFEPIEGGQPHYYYIISAE